MLALVAAGVIVGIVEPGRFTYALGHAALYIFLPALLFEAAWNLNYRAIRRQWAAIATLAGLGVLVTAAIVTGALSVARVPFASALLTGAMLSATDPIAVIGIFRQFKVPLGLVTLIECEALFNDAVAVVLYRAVLLALAVPLTARSVGVVTLLSVGSSLGGVALGIALAYVVARILRNRGNVSVQIAATILCAYGSYLLAEYLHCSGIFAVVACGISLRYFERAWIELSIAADVERFWDVIALAANAIVFVLIGAALVSTNFLRDPIFVIAGVIGVVIARAAVSGLLLPAGLPREWLDVVGAAGQRGALCMVLALAVPPAIPYRDAIIACTFATVLVTLAMSSVTVPAAIRRLRRA